MSRNALASNPLSHPLRCKVLARMPLEIRQLSQSVRARRKPSFDMPKSVSLTCGEDHCTIDKPDQERPNLAQAVVQDILGLNVSVK